MTDLPKGYRWANEFETENSETIPGIIVVPRTADNTGKPYTQGEADLAVPIRKSRPNKNYVLRLLRDNWDSADPWGSGMAAAWAVCESLTAIGSDVPASLGYSPGMGGPEVPGVAFADGGVMSNEDVSYETVEVWEYLDLANKAHADYTLKDRARVQEVYDAATLLSRYLDWCKLAGRDY